MKRVYVAVMLVAFLGTIAGLGLLMMLDALGL